jgi:ParB family chromosome partitioning protein
MKSSKRLGRGLNALIPTENSTAVDGKTNTIQELDVQLIESDPHQPRTTFEEGPLEELKSSIEEKGVIQPILVRPMKNGKYQIVYGERRFRATCELGLKRIPAQIKQLDSDEDILLHQLIENMQRENLNPMDQAKGFQEAITKYDLTQEEIAKKVGKDRTTVANALRLLKLAKVIQGSLRKGEIKEGHARAIVSINDEKGQIQIWKKTVKGSLSVRQVEQLVKKNQKEKEEQQNTATASKTRKSSFVTKMESRLREKFGTQVKIRKRKERGTIEISFYSTEDFNRLMDIFDQIKY